MIEFIAAKIVTPFVLIFLLLCALLIGYDLKFFHLYKIKDICSALFKKSSKKIQSVKALTTALAGTLGVGNITGVASALMIGGPGSIFWMWIAALFSMILKYSEIVLAITHRTKSNGVSQGGAMYYIRNPIIALFFSIFCISTSFTVGNIMQGSALSEIMLKAFNTPKIFCAALLSVSVFAVMCRSLKQISNVTLFCIPFASGVYIIMCLLIIIPNAKSIPSLIYLIISDAFSVKAGAAGFSGYIIFEKMRIGVSRGLLTNEAGCGSAPLAHSSAETDYPSEQGFWGIFEVFADTILICSLSAFAFILSGSCISEQNETVFVLNVFSSVLGKNSEIILCICFFIFVFATMIGWSYYGIVSLEYINQSKKIKVLYTLAYSLCAFVGCYAKTGTSFALADITLGFMTIINCAALLSKRGTIKKLTDEYFKSKRTE